MDFLQNGLAGFAVLAVLIQLFITILWLVIAWRAMRAHEKIADTVEFLVRRQLEQRETQSNDSTEYEHGDE